MSIIYDTTGATRHAREPSRRKRVSWQLAAVVLACAGLLAACTSVVTQRAEAIIRDRLAQTLGPALRYDVEVQGVSHDADLFDRVHVVGFRVARDDAPVLDRLDADFRGVRVDRTEKRIVAIESAAVTADLLAGDLANYLMARGWIGEAKVGFRPASEVVASGRLKLPGMSFGPTAWAEFRGRLLAQGSRLHLSVDSLRLGTLTAPAVLRSLLESTLNPLVDTASFAVPSRIDSVAVEDAALRIRGSGVDLATPPRRAEKR